METEDTGIYGKMPITMLMKKPNFSSSTINKNQKLNWYIHLLFIKQEYDECLKLIEN